MATIRTRVNYDVDLSILERFRDVVSQDLRMRGTGPVRGALRSWAFRYREFLQARYLQFSRGGGDWQPLQESTRRSKGHDAILIDSHAMFDAFEPEFVNKPGQFQQDVMFGIRVGVGGRGIHPTANMEIRELLRIHQLGEGVVPPRETVVPPSSEVLSGMKRDMSDAVRSLI